MAKVPTEEQEQIAVASWLDAKGLLWCHVPNGMARSKQSGARLKRMGVKAGVPDILIFSRVADRGVHVGVAIELKRRNGKLTDMSDNQEWWLNMLGRAGWRVMIAFGADDAVKKLKALGY